MMNRRLPIRPWAFCALLCGLVSPAMSQAPSPVKATETRGAIVLDNGVVTVEISKAKGQVTAIRYRHDGKQTEVANTMYSSYSAGSLEKEALRGGPVTAVRASARLIQSGPETAEVVLEDGPGPAYPFHTETHYILPRGESGFYAYQVYRHDAQMPAATLGEARFVIKSPPGTALYTNHVVDAQRMGEFPASPIDRKVMDATFLHTDGVIYTKYNNSAFMADHHVHGMAGHGLGIWFINASNEYVNGGPIKQELTVHMDNTLLNMLEGAHFGAGVQNFARGEGWTKLYGPFFVYVNAGKDVPALYADAKKRADREIAQWPYAWMDNPEYPKTRGGVSGQLKLTDGPDAANAWVILAEPGADWTQQGKGYEFWTKTDSAGRFTISQVRPGKYTLYSYGAGQFEQYHQENVVVEAGKTTPLGVLDWTPVEHGRTLWRIGVPDRSSSEFRDGDDVRHWANYMRYPQDFPNDVTFTIGKSQERTDWGFAQWTWYAKKPVWAIQFDQPRTLSGKATLTLGFAAANPVHGNHVNLEVKVNGTSVATVHPVKSGPAAYRSGGQDSLYQVEYVTFDAGLLKAGTNEITLGHTEAQPFPAPDVQMHGEVGVVMYDAIRLEVEESK